MAEYRANTIPVLEASLDRLYDDMEWWNETNIERLSFEAVTATDQRQAEAFYKSMQDAVGLNVGGYVNETGLDKILEKAVADNVEQITDLVEEDKARVRRILNKSLITQRGKSAQLTTELLKGFKTDINQARFIARDQTQRLTNSLNEFRQQGAGITKYKWSTSNDGAVRPTHRANRNKIFRWDRPPAKTGHPGYDYNCRCVAIPVLEIPDV